MEDPPTQPVGSSASTLSSPVVLELPSLQEAMEEVSSTRRAAVKASRRVQNQIEFESSPTSSPNASQVHEIPSTDSLRDAEIAAGYTDLTEIGSIARIDPGLIPSKADLMEKKTGLYLRYEKAVVNQLRKLGGFSDYVGDHDELINNLVEAVEKETTTENKLKLLNLIPQSWKRCDIEATFKVGRGIVNKMERFKK